MYLLRHEDVCLAHGGLLTRLLLGHCSVSVTVTLSHNITLTVTLLSHCNTVAVVTREVGATLAAAGGAGLGWAGLAGRSDGLAASSPRHGSQVPHTHTFKHTDFRQFAFYH